jgi:prepilin-type processing-associated H-X9-DG protein
MTYSRDTGLERLDNLAECPNASTVEFKYPFLCFSYGPNWYTHYAKGGSVPFANINTIKAPSRMIDFGEVALSTSTSGRDDASLYDEYFCMGRVRHGGGSNYLFVDGYVVFHFPPEGFVADEVFMWCDTTFSAEGRWYPLN